MSKYVIDSSTLTSIADAVRTKGGTTDPIVVSDIPTAITNLPSGGGDGNEDSSNLVLTGNCQWMDYKGNWDWWFEKYRDKITSYDINNAICMFRESKLTEIPRLNLSDGCSLANAFLDSEIKTFENNIKQIYDSGSMFCRSKVEYVNFPELISISGGSGGSNKMFSECNLLKEIHCPKLTTIQGSSYRVNNMFENCYNIRYIDIPLLDTTGQENMFSSCFSLRELPFTIKSGNNYRYSSQIYNYGFNFCCSLDEIINLGVASSTFTTNSFNSTVNNCYRLKNLTFAKQEDNSPIVVNWKSQTINLSYAYVGYTSSKHNILEYNSGITADKEVTDDATYQALKNDPDWFTCNKQYSRYNHDSAVATINSLPDTSAYLATAGGTNTIKFEGQAGALTDGGAINTLTEEEIAVAAAKGWTVTLV